MLLIALLQPIKEVCLLSTYLLSETSPTMASVLITNRIYMYMYMYIHYITSIYICFRSTYASNIIIHSITPAHKGSVFTSLNFISKT